MSNLKERMIQKANELKEKEFAQAPDSKETILNSQMTINEISDASKNLEVVEKIEGDIEETDSIINNLESNENPTNEDIVATEMLLNKFKFEYGLTDTKLTLENIKINTKNPKAEKGRLIKEFHNVRKEMELAREGFIKDFLDKIKNIFTSFKDNVTPGLKKMLARVTGKLKSHDFALACKEYEKESLGVFQAMFDYEVSKIATAHYIFDLKVPSINLENVKTLPKVPVNKKYGLDVFRFVQDSLYFGLLIADKVENKDKDGFIKVARDYSFYLDTMGPRIASHIKGIKPPKDWLVNTNIKGTNDSDINNFIKKAIDSTNKIINDTNKDEALKVFGNIEAMAKEMDYHIFLMSGFDTLFLKEKAGDNYDDNYRGLNGAINFDGSLCRLILGNMFGTIIIAARASKLIMETEDFMDLYYKNNK